MAVDPRKVLPTKINLIRLRRELAMLRRIRRVMEEKREVILHYITSMAAEYVRYQREVYSELERIYQNYYLGVAAEGIERARAFTAPAEGSLEVDVSTRTLFAVKTPVFRLREETVPPLPLPAGSDPKLVQSILDMGRILDKLLKLAEYEETLQRLISELKDTQRLINALDYVILPSYQNAIKYIKLVLEDRMREDFVRLKMIKRKMEAKTQ
ncbi:V-type ATP synthase subunit D [Aeropyrum pernix]|uniref:A-type ATP synthase subunit D n=1 Tax=Aeropyrum pernix TaxID=56636 RepID=A0A401HAB4_AERPX|nr:V-type ATP synthase subunit D [Aeropyrum pernix]GBF09334.1 V-type ATP synthase subunit D [Aeropyrum pernix]